MLVNEINSVPLPPTGEGGASNTTSLTQTFDDFLVLLITQLQNQDPLSPVEATQFTEQLVQFSGVEQAINTNSKLDELIALQSGNQLNAAVSYIGRDVEADSEMTSLQNGTATILYGLDATAASTTIGIVDESGQLVRTYSGDTSTGLHELVWDGLNDQGIAQPDGVYGILVTARDADNQSVTAATGTRGRVTGVESQGDEVFLKLGDLLVPLTRVFAVDEADTLNVTA